MEEYWDDLKKRIRNKGTVSIRRYGRNAKNPSMYLELYKKIFDNDQVIIDSTNNEKPQKLIEKLTGKK